LPLAFLEQLSWGEFINANKPLVFGGAVALVAVTCAVVYAATRKYVYSSLLPNLFAEAIVQLQTCWTKAASLDNCQIP